MSRLESARKYRENNREKVSRSAWASKLKHKYGMTLSARAGMALHQQDRCAICLEETELVIDHCHNAGYVRGLLCGPCNRGLGLFKDNTDTLQRAIQYLTKVPPDTRREGEVFDAVVGFLGQ